MAAEPVGVYGHCRVALDILLNLWAARRVHKESREPVRVSNDTAASNFLKWDKTEQSYRTCFLDSPVRLVLGEITQKWADTVCSRLDKFLSNTCNTAQKEEQK
jgi:hypothetical protein